MCIRDRYQAELDNIEKIRSNKAKEAILIKQLELDKEKLISTKQRNKQLFIVALLAIAAGAVVAIINGEMSLIDWLKSVRPPFQGKSS